MSIAGAAAGARAGLSRSPVNAIQSARKSADFE